MMVKTVRGIQRDVFYFWEISKKKKKKKFPKRSLGEKTITKKPLSQIRKGLENEIEFTQY